jgi:uncharacterized protein YfeS
MDTASFPTYTLSTSTDGNYIGMNSSLEEHELRTTSHDDTRAQDIH